MYKVTLPGGRQTSRLAVLWLAIILGSSLAACAEDPGRQAPLVRAAAQAAAASASAVIAPPTVATLMQKPAELSGRMVTVSGRFAGWEGGCTGPPPRNRSDWMLIDAPHCIYVSGPVPEGIAPPPDISSIGQSVTLNARVELTDDGRAYLRR